MNPFLPIVLAGVLVTGLVFASKRKNTELIQGKMYHAAIGIKFDNKADSLESTRNAAIAAYKAGMVAQGAANVKSFRLGTGEYQVEYDFAAPVTGEFDLSHVDIAGVDVTLIGLKAL